jgi:hypothetical protein
MSGLLINLLI